MAPDTTAAAPAAAGTLALPAELTIYAAAELHAAWRAWLEQGGQRAEGSAVEQVDGAGVQLLLSLQRAMAARGRRLEIQAPSRVLAEGCATLGLGAWLAEHAAPESAPA
jgi:ABC-type transporter Mla MlaB component